jgi:hypothetical protein
MRRNYIGLAGIAALAIFAFSGCAGATKLTNVWTDPQFQTNSIKKVMIIGVAKSSGIRRTFEDSFVAALQVEGMGAVASYSLTGDGPVDSAKVYSAITSSGCDGIIVTRMTDKKTVDTYYAPTTSYVGAPGAYYGGWYGYYSMGYAYTSSPGYTVQNEVVNLETNLYRVADAKLVWSALSESWLEQSGNPGGEIKPFVNQLVASLSSSKVVTTQKK